MREAFQRINGKSVKPLGWMKDQLRIQAQGLSGNLDLIWPDIRDSRWIGGNREGWERVPYWLDGFIPLAYLTNDRDMKRRAKFYIDNILARQQEDGWICPCTKEERPDYDMWAAILISKVFVLYREFSGEKRIDDALIRSLRCMYEHIQNYPLKNWGRFRWFEALFAIRYVYDLTKDPLWLDMAKLMRDQGFDYASYYLNDWPEKVPKPRWTMESHVVNNAMAIKGDTLYELLFGDPSRGRSEEMYELLMRYHGTSAGHFSGDECLAGKDPTHGAELCSIAEAMFSYETLFFQSGDVRWMDRAERLAFNSLPATCSEDMWTHQYDQQINQTACVDQYDNHIYMTNLGQSGLFGLEPNFGCCTANFNQAFPKFAMSAYGRSGDTILSAALIPSRMKTRVKDAYVTVTLETEYPFKGTLRYTIEADKPVRFTFAIRIPSWAGETTVRTPEGEQKAKAGKIFRISRRFEGVSEIEVGMSLPVRVIRSDRNLYHVERGALTFSLPVGEHWVRREYTKDGVERKYPYCDYSVFPTSDWNYAFRDTPEQIEAAAVEETSVGSVPFSHKMPPVRIGIRMVHIPWQTAKGQPFICAPYPSDTTPISQPEMLWFVPYGCARLRMTDLPFAKDKKNDG